MAATDSPYLAIPTKLGSQTQVLWEKILDVLGDDPVMLSTFGTTALVMVIYWTYAGIFSVIDITNRPRWLVKYKIQPDQNVPVDMDKFWKAVKQVLFNQFVVTPAFLYLCNLTIFQSWLSTRELPSLTTYLVDIALMALIEEPLFYYAHRMLHHRSIYKYIHKKHHEWTAPIAAITFYCHPVEHIVSNIGPIAVAAVLIKAHIVVVWTFTFLAIVNSMSDHTGYSFPFPLYKSSVVFHDYHHAKFNYNFGVFGWLDKLHGTFKESPMGWKATTDASVKTKKAKPLKKKK